MSSLIEMVDVIREKFGTRAMFFANAAYDFFENEMTPAAYYKSLERLCKDGNIGRVSKGIYYVMDADGEGIADEEIIDFYMHDDHGVMVGQQLYFAEGLVGTVKDTYSVKSNLSAEQKRKIQNVFVEHIDLVLNEERKKVIQVLDVLENYEKIEELNRPGLAKYLEKYAFVSYSDEAANYVLDHLKYKKVTVAFLKAVLDYHQVTNTLGARLSPVSKYKVPNIIEVCTGHA